MQITSRMAWNAWGGADLVEAHVQRRLPAGRGAPHLQDLTHLAQRPPMAAAFLADLRRSMQPDTARRFAAFDDPRTLAVVTGQQPGCMGGALLVLLKAATAVALARRASDELERPVVPLFWNGADDVDFDEIARVAWPGKRGELLFIELPREGRRAQGFVGDLPVTGDVAATQAALDLLEPSERRQLAQLLPRQARDHGSWVSELLQALFPDLAVVDARHAALRRHAAPLYARYLDVEEDVPAKVEAVAQELEAAGFRRTLAPESLRRGLFLVDGGQRQKVEGNSALLRRALAEAPETLAPNVMLRALVQDTLFPVVASVVGPSEVGYLHELQELRQTLQVPPTAVVPRLSLTWLATAGWESLKRLGISPESLVQDPDETLRSRARERLRPALEPARASFAALEAEITALPLHDDTGTKARGLRRLRGLQNDLERGIEAAELETLLRDEPELQRLRRILRPLGRPQERLLAGLFFVARQGATTGESLVQVAAAHLDTLEQRALAHWLVVD